ncbi:MULTISPECIES: hypothetical protein [unclassified Spirillospora]|uniref:hypothetical protein n=1 Tax=unclassified Spirillospora TaxID=2642701 RepID=UPI0037219AC7
MLELRRAGSALLDSVVPIRTVRGIPRDRRIGLPDERALHRVLASGREGYWAMVTVHVGELATLDGERATMVLRFLADRLDKILNDEVSTYQTTGGFAILVGPGDELYKTRHGTRLLLTAVTRKLTEPVPPRSGISPPSLSFDAVTDELPQLRLGLAPQPRRARRG